MSYCLKSVIIRTNNDRIAEINEVWRDIFNGKLPLLFDSKNEAIKTFPISCYENYANDETGDYDLSIISADQAYLQQVWQQSRNGIIKRAFTHDYELSLRPQQTPDQRFHTILYIALA